MKDIYIQHAQIHAATQGENTLGDRQEKNVRGGPKEKNNLEFKVAVFRGNSCVWGFSGTRNLMLTSIFA